MKILIIALPRTGSTTLLYRTAKEKNLKAFFEPFSLKENYYFNSNMKNIVVKTIIHQHPDNVSLAKDFDEVILLSRKNLKSHTESLAYLYHNAPEGYNSNNSYSYIEPPLKTLEKAKDQILKKNKELKALSKELNVPIQYYEDLFDENSPDRLRIKNIPSKRLL